MFFVALCFRVVGFWGLKFPSPGLSQELPQRSDTNLTPAIVEDAARQVTSLEAFGDSVRQAVLLEAAKKIKDGQLPSDVITIGFRVREIPRFDPLAKVDVCYQICPEKPGQ